MNILKKLGIITGLGFAGISLMACNEEDTTTTPTSSPSIIESTKEEVVLKKLKVVSNRNYEYALKGHEYVANVTVTGIYSDLEEVVLTDLVTFSSLDTSVVGNKSVTVSYEGVSADYTVKVIEPTVTNMVCAYSAIKLNYNVGDTYDSTGLYCYLYYEDDIREETKDYSITILDSNNNVYSSRTFNMTGMYTIRITYQTFQSEYPITVTDSSSNNINTNVNSITLDTTNVKTSYQAGEALSFDDLVVNGVTSNGNVILTDYSYEVYNSSNNLVTNTSSLAAGNYTVKIIYGSCSQFYNITVTSDQSDTFDIKFSISGAEYNEYWVTLTRYESVNPLELISDYIPSGYVFCGFGGTNGIDWSNPNPDSTYDLWVKIYVSQNQSGKALVCFTDANYEYITYKYYDLNSNVTELPIYSSILNNTGYVFVDWEDENKLSPVTSNCYIFPNLAYIDGTLNPTINTSSTGEVTIDLGLSNNYAYQYYLELTNFDGYSQAITSNESNYQLTLNTTYNLKGKVVYNTSDGLCAKTIDYSFVNSYYSSLSNLSEDNVQIVSYANGMVVGTQEYVDATPDGYVFKALAIFDEDGNQVDIQEYNGEASLTFYGIEEGNYRIDAYYDLEENGAISLLSYNTFGPDDYYGLHVVGYWIWFGPCGDPLCKVELVYQNDLLYTFYYGKGSYPRDVFRFILPKKYAGYQVLGSLDYVSEINEDQVWELIVAPYNSQTSIVLFYSHDYQEVIDYQEVSSLDDIVYPSDDLSYVSKNGCYKYVFKEWNVPSKLYNITSIYPKFTRTIIDESLCQYEPMVYYESDYLFFTYNLTGKTYANNIKYYICGGNYLTKTEVQRYEIDNIKPSTTYICTLEYTFTLSTLEEITISKEVTITTPSQTYIDDSEDTLKVTYISYGKIGGFTYNSIYGLRLSNENFSQIITSFSRIGSFDFLYLNVSTEYLLTYYIKDDDGAYVGYQNKIYKTTYADKPEFDEIYVTLENGFGIIHLTHENAEEIAEDQIEISISLYVLEIDRLLNYGNTCLGEYNGDSKIIGHFDFPKVIDEVDGKYMVKTDEYGNPIYYDCSGWESISISYYYDGVMYMESFGFNYDDERNNITNWAYNSDGHNMGIPTDGTMIYKKMPY